MMAGSMEKMKEQYFKNIYSHGDFYKALVLLFRSIPYLRINRKARLISPQFKERIMLAVTEVNGCQACSYAHTKFALEEGMNPDEIKAILGGEIKDIPENEMLGILFAQHYADEKGKASKESWQRLVDEYGKEAALIILAMIRMIQVGNIYGMAISALRDRFKGKASGKTTLIYELSILIMILIYIPPAFIHATFDRIRKKSIEPS